MRPVPIQSPDWLAPFLTEARDAIMELQTPTYPHRAYRHASTNLPPAADFAGCVIDLTDIATLAKSNGTNWLRIDTGAPL